MTAWGRIAAVRNVKPNFRGRPGAVICDGRLPDASLVQADSCLSFASPRPRMGRSAAISPCVAQPPHPLVAVDQALWSAVVSKLEDSGSADLGGGKRRASRRRAGARARQLRWGDSDPQALHQLPDRLGPAEEFAAGLNPRRNCVGRDAPAPHALRTALAALRRRRHDVRS